jgi:PleD family two-component response regulator
MVLAIVDDLLLGSKIRAAARHTGRTIVFARDAERALDDIRAQRPDLVIVDLDRAPLDPIGLVRDIKTSADLSSLRVIGFVSHVHVDRMHEARAAGIDSVLARSAFFAKLPDILSETPAEPPAFS